MRSHEDDSNDHNHDINQIQTNDSSSSLSSQELQYYLSLLPKDRTEQFFIDLEFLQNLCNARYLFSLSQQGYFQKPEFIKYLQYLTYWKDPKYLKFILFPQCLAILDAILQKEDYFRDALTLNEFIEHLHIQQGLHWTKGRKKDSPSHGDAMDIIEGKE